MSTGTFNATIAIEYSSNLPFTSMLTGYILYEFQWKLYRDNNRFLCQSGLKEKKC
jgi:hypothetical protein